MSDNIETDQELLEVFLEESREHLSGIEEDLLDIEAAGADFDDALVNKVFRAAHSIKGAAGFFGLSKVKDLAHAMENVLGKIRARELLPSRERVGTLLASADVLSNLINNLNSTEEIEIGPLLVDLSAALGADIKPAANPSPATATNATTATTTTSPPNEPPIEPPMAAPAPPPDLPSGDSQKRGPLEVYLPDGSKAFSIPFAELLEAARAERGGRHFYLVEIDLATDLEQGDLADFILEHEQMVKIVAAGIDLDAMHPLRSFPEQARLPFRAVVSSSMDSETFVALMDLPALKLRTLKVNLPQSFAQELPQAAKIQPQRQDLQLAEVTAPAADSVATVTTPVAQTVTPSVPSNAAAPKSGGKRSANQTKAAPETSIRVKLDTLDHLMTLAGELVLTRNQLLQSVGSDDAKTYDASQRIDLVTTELQDAIMSTRMQSIGTVFHKFKRMVRDIGHSLGKDIQLVLEGEEVELDKTIIEAIGDPLTHLVRNSLDHGIEPMEQRQACGKPRQGTLRLSAMHKAGSVFIEIEDDGGGIDPQKIKHKAFSKGLFSAEQLDAMSDPALIKLIFMPGFSLAQEVTDLSGRGVGMDVVHSALSRLGGVVDIESSVGVGTVIRVKLPLTLAIIPCILVAEEGSRFAIPQASLVELHRVSPSAVASKIEKIGEALVMRLRGELLPLIRLRDALDMDRRSFLDPEDRRLPDLRTQVADRRTEQSAELSEEIKERRRIATRRHHAGSGVNIAIVAAGDFRFGLIVEALQDSLEIVVKPLGRHLRGCQSYAGATILGDGRPALILDVVGLSKILRDNGRGPIDALNNAHAAPSHPRRELLIVRGPEQRLCAVPLAPVERIERVHTQNLVKIAERLSMSYRDHSLRVAGIPIGTATAQEGSLAAIQDHANFVVILSQEGRELGLLVSEIVDIVTWDQEIDTFTHKQAGISGSFFLSENLVLLLDVPAIARHIAPDLFKDQTPQAPEASGLPATTGAAQGASIKTVLVVDDSPLFRKKISSLVEESGHKVLSADDGDVALELLQENAEAVQLILTDIEMPRLDGFEFSRQVREQAQFDQIPIVAVTTLLSQEAKNKGRNIGIDEHMVKLDAELLMQRVEFFLQHGRGR